MTRLLLSLFVCATALGVGLVTACCQSRNHARAQHLDEVLRECELIRAGNESLAARRMQRHFEFDRDEIGREELADSRGVSE